MAQCEFEQTCDPARSGGRRWRLPLAAATALLVAVGCGGGGGGETPPAAPTLRLLAGNSDGRGIADGTGSAARFNTPIGVALDASGNAYVADTASNTIRKVTPAGVVSTWAGSPGEPGSADGNGTEARFDSPYGIAVDAAGQVYVADAGNDVIRKISPAGVVTTLAGTADVWGYADGTGAAARFRGPSALAVDAAGNVYVTDSSNFLVRKITPDGVVTTLAGTVGVQGDTDGPGATARFRSMYGIAVDAAGNAYVGGFGGGYTIRRISPAGEVSTYAGTTGVSGLVDGPAATARFSNPFGLAADAAGNVYVADSGTVRKITPAGEVTTLAGRYVPGGGTVDGTGAQASFGFTAGLASTPAGDLAVVDPVEHTLRAITPAGVVSTRAGAPALRGSTDGQGTAARFNNPRGLGADSQGNLYVADTSNATVRRITPSGVVSTFAGTAGSSGSADGTGAAARFALPWGVAADGADNLYVVDTGNSTVRRITPDGVVTTLAGTAGVTGGADGTGAAASFDYPEGVAVAADGHVYVADTYSHTIRKVSPAGVVTTLAGSVGVTGSADGTGPAASFRYPTGVAVDAAGQVYVADQSNGTIRKISPAGVVTTLAGSPGAFDVTDGTGAAAHFGSPVSLALAPNGDLYVADASGQVVRKVTPAGVVTTVVGRPMRPGFAPGPMPGLLVTPTAVAVQGDTLYVVTSQGVASVTPLP